MSKYRELFAKNLSSAMHNNRLSQTDVAKKLGVTPQVISRVLSAKNATTLDKMVELAETVGVSPSYLLMTEDERMKLRAVEDLNTRDRAQRLHDEMDRIKVIVSELQERVKQPGVPQDIADSIGAFVEDPESMHALRHFLGVIVKKKSEKSGKKRTA